PMKRLLIVLALCYAPALLWTAAASQDDGLRGKVVVPELLIVSKRDGNANIYLVNAKGENAKNLTKSESENSYPAWSPNGKKIAFASDRDGAMNIYVMDADGSNVKQLTKSTERTRAPAWSPDGKKIAFGRTVGDGCGIFVMDADGSNERQIGSEDGWEPAWSADGKKILFTSRRDANGVHIYQMDADRSNAQPLTT